MVIMYSIFPQSVKKIVLDTRKDIVCKGEKQLRKQFFPTHKNMNILLLFSKDEALS